MKPINPLNIHPEIRDYEAAHSLKCSGWPGDPNSDAVVERLIEIHPVFIARKFDSSIMGVQHTLVQRVCYSGYISKSGRQAVINLLENASETRYIQEYPERNRVCCEHREKHLKTLLANKDVNVNAVDDNGYTALGYILSDNPQEARLLLRKEGLDLHGTKRWIEEDNREQLEPPQ